jgi:hypothetical protein
MSWFSRFRKRTEASAPETPPQRESAASHADVNLLMAAIIEVLQHSEKSDPDLDLLRARLADLCRDMKLNPMEPEAAMAQLKAMDVESQKRLTFAVAGFVHEGAQQALTVKSRSYSAVQLIELLTGFARAHSLLTTEILLQSSVRREEFVRQLCARLDAQVVGETSEESAERLAQLDYGKLLAAVEAAKLSAEGRTAYLRKLQEEQEQKLGRRSKF